MTDTIIISICGLVFFVALGLYVHSRIKERKEDKQRKEKEDLRKAVIEDKLWSDELESLDLSDENYKYYREFRN